MSFRRDLEVGKLGEKICRKKLEEFGFKTEDSNDRKIDFFVKIGRKKYSCECKLDVYSAKSGNLAIETFNTKTGKPSGLHSTECHFWFHVLSDNEVYFSKTDELRKFIKNNKAFKEIHNAGDNNAYILLYKKENICDVSLLKLSKEVMLKCL